MLQAYVIATSTLVDISKVDVSKFDDAYFKSSDKAEKKKGEDGFFDTQTEKKELGSEYIENQKKVLSTGCCSQVHVRSLRLFTKFDSTSLDVCCQQALQY